ncbi:MAG TPA: TrkH family potassium uptake protein [Tissierellaceae bacterium]|nr:TrkH family potassium uptake protein [Tissierellaceae bacterium]
MGRIFKWFTRFELNPPRILALGFGSLILIGTLLLNLPIATASGESIGIIDALFTSASAVCVTGLVVVNTAEFWSLFGKIVILILILIQIGGLGVMTMATAGALIIGKRITLKERLVIKEQLNQKSMSGLVRLTIYVLIATFAIEAVGAILLSIRFIPIYGLGKGIWFSIFHSISAFCNAGFDITGNSIVPFAGDLLVSMIISLLVILGGIGFSVFIDVTKNRRFKKFNIHTKMVLTITAILLTVGMAAFLIIEFNNPNTIGNMSGKNKILSSFFQSVVPRTAGFNSVDIGGVLDTTTFFMIILMFIGGSPGSTAGGVKTTTIGTLMLTTISIIRGNKDVVIYKRRINEDVINRALAIIVVSMVLIIVVASILTITEEFIFLDVLFETTSAFATVGLSRGITPHLSTMGKIIIALTMYAGRVGVLTMAFAFAQKNKDKKYRYAEGNIIVG